MTPEADVGGAAPSSFFVSYAREDQAFVQRLYDALVGRGREVWVDWEAVPALAPWRPEVTAAIEAADVFVFVVSPDSAQSEVCLQEVGIAAAAHKRFAPLILRQLEDDEAAELPAPIRDPNWIFLRAGDGFDDGIGRLVTAADTDYAWLRLHTRLQVRAREWDDAGRDESLLTRGRDLEAAQHWLAESALRTERDVSPLQVAFLEAARAREAAEAERTREAYARALARQLAAQSELVRGADVESVRTSVLLAAESVERWPTVEGDRALRRGLALLSRRPLRRIDHPARHVALGRDGVALATAEGKSVSIWDVPSGRLVARRRCDAEVVSLMVSRDGAWVVAVDAEHHVRLWPADGRGRGRGFDCGAPVVAVALGGESVAVAVEGAILAWAPGRRSPARRVPVDGEVTALAVGAAGQVLVATVNVGWNGSLRVWSLPAGEPTDSIALGGIVNAAAFAADGDTLVALAVPTGPGMGPLRGYEDVRLLHLLESWQQGHLVVDELRHDTPVRRLALGPTDEYVATVAEPAIVHVWSAVSGRPRGRVSSATPIRTFAVSADGDRLATAHDDGTVRLTDVASASSVLAVEADGRAVAVDAEGRLVVTGDDETVVWSGRTGSEIARTQVGFPAGTLAFGPGQLLVTRGETGVTLLDTDGGGAVTSLPHEGGVLAAAFAPGGGRVVTVSAPSFGTAGTRGDGDLRVWDVAERTVVSRLARAELGVFALSPDGRRLADAASADVEVRDVASGAATHRLAAGAEVKELAFSAGGGQLAIVAGDGVVRVWDLATSEPGPQRQLGNAWIAGVDPAGRYLAVESSGSFHAWLLDLELDRTLEVEGIEQPTNHAVLDAAGRFAALTTDLGPVEVRALPSAEVLVRLNHDAFGVAFSPDGAHVATAGADGALRVWELAGGAEVARMDHADKLFSPLFDSDGRLLAASCADGSVWVWTWRPADLAAEARARAGRGLTAEERAAYLPDG